MVRNAVRIINLTIYKLNDQKLNECILSDVPYCLAFVNQACMLRTKICALDKVINSSEKVPFSTGEQQTGGNDEAETSILSDLFSALRTEESKDQAPERRELQFDRVLDFIEEIEDILEHAQETFEVENDCTRQLFANALLHYVFLPVIKGALTNLNIEAMELPAKFKIGANTALFALAKTIDMIEYKPFVDSLFVALLGDEGPQRLVQPKMTCEYGKMAESLFGEPRQSEAQG